MFDMASLPPWTIVAFGDSLTTGFQNPSADNPEGRPAPYGRFLREQLGNLARVRIRGVNGELTSQMLGRLNRDVIREAPDFAIILGGTNDLGHGLAPETVWENLREIYDRLQRRGIVPVAITVPSIRGWDELIPPRRRLNELILSHCRSMGIPCVDLFSDTAEPDSGRLQDHYSNDGLHLNPAGYQLLAQRLYQEVFEPRLRSLPEGPSFPSTKG